MPKTTRILRLGDGHLVFVALGIFILGGAGCDGSTAGQSSSKAEASQAVVDFNDSLLACARSPSECDGEALEALTTGPAQAEVKAIVEDFEGFDATAEGPEIDAETVIENVKVEGMDATVDACQQFSGSGGGAGYPQRSRFLLKQVDGRWLVAEMVGPSNSSPQDPPC